ncbi:MAG TPA: FtsW/RodA/SpoVE family cell cycle protein [Actinomycetota bacterium]|nr:FtsW/RodA/SpoVE family cell cycle protein [Actinomycetota bacterium]
MAVGQASSARGLTLRVGGLLLRELDFMTIGAVIGLVSMGLLSIFTATVDPEQGTLLGFQASSALFNRQLVFIVLASATLLAAVLFDYRHFKVYAIVMYLICLFVFLVVLTPIGDSARGSQRWLSLGLFKLQPAELAKPVLVAALASYIVDKRGRLGFPEIFRCIGITAPYAFLVFIQPDFGTMLVLLWILLTMLIVGGADWRHLVILLVIGVTGVIGLFRLGIVQDYQQQRLQAFLDPSQDPFKEGYNYRLTRTAVGNGGFLGKGIFSKRDPVNLTNLDFVREQPTDFVFTAVAEQMGFLGGATVLFLFGVVFVRGLRGAAMARDTFGTLLASGLVSFMTFQVFVNIGMTVGLVPITGIPLPFVSYGGSSLVSSSLAVGLLLSVRMRRFARA